MNTKTLKGVGAAASLLIGIGAASPALAATGSTTGLQSLSFPANSIDVWTFSCPPGTVSAQARVYGYDGPGFMQVVLGEDSFPTAQATDITNGGPTLPSPLAVVADGPGLYAMAFKKTAAGVKTYSGEAFCVNGAGSRVDLNSSSSPPLNKMRISQ